MIDDESVFNEKLGRKLRSLRMMQGMTQQELATALGVSFQQLQKYETGANRLSLWRMQRLANLFNIPLAALIEEGEHAMIPPDVMAGKDRQALGLLLAYRRIECPANRALLCQLALSLAECLPRPAKSRVGKTPREA